MKLLADTGALLALALKNDQHHARAAAFVRQHPHARFVITDQILGEVVTRLRARSNAAAAAAAGRSLLDSQRYEVFFVQPALLRNALSRLEQLEDTRLSLTDCVSFELMDQLGLPGAFAFDSDFRNCGYDMLP